MKILILSHKNLEEEKKTGTGTRISHIVKHFSKKHEVRYVTTLCEFDKDIEWCDCIYIIHFQSVLKHFDFIMSTDKPIFYELQSFWAWENPCPDDWMEMEHNIIEESKAVFVFSTQLKDYYVNKGIDKNKIYITLPGFDMDDFEFIVTYLGNFEQWQGLDMLFEVAKMFPWITFMLIGEKKGECPNLSNIEYVGYKSGKEKMRLLKQADLLVIPRKNIQACQTMPGKIADYVLASREIMSTRVCDLPEYADSVCMPNTNSLTTIITNIYNEKKNDFKKSCFNIDNIVNNIIEVMEK